MRGCLVGLCLLIGMGVAAGGYRDDRCLARCARRWIVSTQPVNPHLCKRERIREPPADNSTVCQSGTTSISFTELFPPASLADYLGFAYFGIMQTRDIFDDVIDTSLIIAYAAGSGVGQTVGDTFPYTEAELVDALTNSFDSPEFFDMLDTSAGQRLHAWATSACRRLAGQEPSWIWSPLSADRPAIWA